MSTIAQAPADRPTRPAAAPLNCSIFVTDIVGFGDPRRDDNDRLVLRSALLEVLRASFAESGLPWRRCRHQDRGDGFLTILPPTISTTPLVDPLLPNLADRIRQHNRGADAAVRIRLRCAVHVGPVLVDRTGYPSASVILSARMLDSGPLRRAMAAVEVELGAMVSGYVYDTVVRHLRGPLSAAAFRPSHYRSKGVPITSWLYLSAAESGDLPAAEGGDLPAAEGGGLSAAEGGDR